jgi:hypothetical protein
VPCFQYGYSSGYSWYVGSMRTWARECSVPRCSAKGRRCPLIYLFSILPSPRRFRRGKLGILGGYVVAWMEGGAHSVCLSFLGFHGRAACVPRFLCLLHTFLVISYYLVLACLCASIYIC